MEPAFQVSRASAFARGLVAAVVVAIIVDQTHAIMMGAFAALTALAIAAVCAPPRALELLRAELRAPRVRRSVPIGPALTYAFTVLAAPFMIWISLIVVRVYGGLPSFDTPWCSFTLVTAVYLVLLVETLRARRQAIA